MAKIENTPVLRRYSEPETREEEADRALRSTLFPPGVAALLCGFFLCTIASVPIVQRAVEVQRDRAAQQGARKEHKTRYSVPSASEIRAYETALEDQSVLSEWALPSVQWVLTGYLGAGNEQAYVGRAGWLMYRPDVEYVTGRGFLNPDHRHVAPIGNEKTTSAQPDPVKALVRFHEQLSRRGIRLIVVPVPVKPMIHPEYLSTPYQTPKAAGGLQNPSYDPFLKEMGRARIEVFDPTNALNSMPGPLFLETDTHWTPDAMDRTASELAQRIQDTGALSDTSDTIYTRGSANIEGEGDIAAMLRLPSAQRIFIRQSVRIRPVMEAFSETPWRARRDADVLLLGDSFSNIYSLGEMGWGEAAGFAEQISYHLKRPLDAIIVNAGGAYASRQKLVQEMKRGQDRLRGKRLVIYEFAMRDLSSGDWKLLDLPETKDIARKSK